MRSSLRAIAVLVTVFLSDAHADPTFFVRQAWEVGQLPRPNNNAHVAGHDNGSSVLLNGTSYWFFADTTLDVPPYNDALDSSDNKHVFKSTVAWTTDKALAGGVDLTTYKRDAQGNAAELFPDSPETLAWAAGSIVVNGKIYIYGEDISGGATGHAPRGDAASYFLARFNPADQTTTRIITWPLTDYINPRIFNSPTLVTNPVSGLQYVYLLGYTDVDLGAGMKAKGYLVGRVPAAGIEDVNQYEYWKGPAPHVFDTNPLLATPIFQEYFGAAHASLAFRPELNRFLIVYSCANAFSLCGRTANITGNTAIAVTGSWDSTADSVEMLKCPQAEGFPCYAEYQHTEFGKRLVVSLARLTPLVDCSSDAQCQCQSLPTTTYFCPTTAAVPECVLPNLVPRYEISIYEFKLKVKKPTRIPQKSYQVIQPQLFYYPVDHCDAPSPTPVGSKWSFQRLTNGALTNLTFDRINNWHGPEASNSAPSIDQATSMPAPSSDAVRVFAAAPGKYIIKGEVRKKQSCGDSVTAELVHIKNGAPYGVPIRVYSLSPTTRTIPVQARVTITGSGESIGFLVRSAGASSLCDDVNFTPTIWFQAAN